MKSENQQKKPYPKMYAVAAVAFAVLFFSVWGFFGILYMNDMQVLNHCKMSILANNAAEFVSSETPLYDDANKVFLEISNLSADMELNEAESKALQSLTDCMANLKTKMDAGDAYDGKAEDERAAFLTAAKNLSAVSQDTAQEAVASSKKKHLRGDYSMTAIFVVVIASIVYIGFVVRKKEAVLDAQEEANKSLKANVERTRSKVYEIAYKNFLLDCGNRYALKDALDKKAKEGKTYYLAQFTLSTYSSLISMFGYNSMDDCLPNVAKRIQDKYAGSLFSLSDDTFVFMFDGNSAITAKNYAEQIRMIIRDTMTAHFRVEIPIQGAVLYANKRGEDGDVILHRLYSSTIQSNCNAPISVL